MFASLEAVKNDKKIIQFCRKWYGLICQNYSISGSLEAEAAEHMLGLI